jgi:hypothetical protein
MNTLQQRLRRAGGLGAVAVLAFPLAAQAADYRAQLSESFNNGMAAARPAIVLRAVFDNGSGGAPLQTGVVRFTIDSRHLTASAFHAMVAAPSGTTIGNVATDLFGSSPLRVLSSGKDASGTYVRAGFDVPSTLAPVIGNDTLVFVIRRTPSGAHLTYTVDLHGAVGALAAKGLGSTLQGMTLALRSSIIFGGKSHGITFNPTVTTALANSVLARPCAQAACVTLGAASASSATVHLPKTVTLAAPVDATYGFRYSIGGTGRSGDAVSLESLAASGLVPARGSTMVKPDGTFVIRATLRSIFTDHGGLAQSARGRYEVASVEGGNATVYGIASQDTKVVLAQPRFVLQRKTGGKLLHFSVRIPGADEHVRVSIKLGARTLVKGYATKSGVFAKTILKPSDRGNLRVVASVPGADTSVSKATPLSR